MGPKRSNKSVDMIDELLHEVIKSGTRKKANKNDFQINNLRGKTGTSQNYRDAWFVGYNNKYIIGVWIGNDNYRPTNKISGGYLPAILFSDIIDKIDR